MLRILCLGDSYTIGEGVAPGERWPMQLAEALRGRGLDVAEPAIIARTGWTTDELLAAMDDARPGMDFDLVTLLVGVNNQYRGRSLEEYRDQFRQLLHRAIRHAGGRTGRVIVISIPDWGVMPFAEGRDRGQIAREIDQFNSVNREESTLAGVHYVDVTPISRRATGEPGLVAGDGLHPSGEMYRQWQAVILPVAGEALAR